MSNQYFYTIIIALLLSLSSCSDMPKNVKQTLKLAGDNKVELQKVIDHYQAPEDSLKLKAAYFLIGNMSVHFYKAFEPEQKWKWVMELGDSLGNAGSKDYKVLMQSAMNTLRSDPNIKFTTHLDHLNIASEELIKNIDLAFLVWDKPWNKSLSFNDFCSFILPYRMKNEPYDINFRSSFYNLNGKQLLDTFSIAEIEKLEKPFGTYYTCNAGGLSSFDQSVRDIEKGRMSGCIGQAIVLGNKFRSIGIPSAIDFTIWPNRNGSHYWNVVPYNKDSIGFVNKDFFWGDAGNFSVRNKVAKIYRYTYASKEDFSYDEEAITFLNTPNIIDVTAQYIETSDINIPLKVKIKKNKKAYLCVFNNRRWKEVAVVDIVDHKEIGFKNIGRGNIYLVASFKNGRLVPVSDIFSVSVIGEMQFYKADRSKTQKVKLTRKTKKTKVKEFAKQMFKTEFQLANSPDFKNAITVYRIEDNDSVFIPKTIQLNNVKKYRYARYRSDLGKVARIAEMTWFSGNKKMHGTIMGDKNTDYKEFGQDAMDDDLLSYFSTGKVDNAYAWVGLDFGEKKQISKLFFAPRSDVNYVKPNDVYELFYWDNEWVSLGTKNPQEYFVEYNNVPKNAVLWLRNLSEGIEEQLFIMKNGRQSFWFSTLY